MAKRSYTEEFKKDAVRLAIELNSVAQAAKQLGTSETNVHGWKEKYQLKDNQVTTSEFEEIKRLKKENEQLKKVNNILSRAAAFFSQDHLK